MNDNVEKTEAVKDMEKEKSLVPSDLAIGRRIYMVRGEQVMIDRDLSELYGVENRALRQFAEMRISFLKISCSSSLISSLKK